ncbi:hypothetical protein I6G46_22970 [Serratia plymuthica]|uniref:hypothetical protein n=1 Tax=Serratia plymuthica TaxID=82996 RepID=UPI0018D76F31|nr:hypothetical protein [Serratia plymuthica]QPS86950.1 hypothetical protein I6G46_22970 [Serratia plymuthica]
MSKKIVKVTYKVDGEEKTLLPFFESFNEAISEIESTERKLTSELTPKPLITDVVFYDDEGNSSPATEGIVIL